MAAALFSLGAIPVPVPGTPVQVTIPVLPGAGPATPALSTVHAFIVEALAANTGKVYIGVEGLDKTTLAGVLVVLPIPTTNLIPTFSVSLTAAANALSLSDLWVDADIATDGVLISGVIA